MHPSSTTESCGYGMTIARQFCGVALLMSGAVVAAQSAQTAQTTGPAVVRCGSSYSNTPCPGGTAVDTDDARSTAQQREAQDVKRRDAAMADQLTGERRAREQDAAGKKAVGIGPPAAASAAQRSTTTAMTTTTKKKKKTGTKKPVTSPPKKLSQAG